MDQGWGLDHQLLHRFSGDPGWSELPQRLAGDPTAARLWAIQQGVCQCGSHMKYELAAAFPATDSKIRHG